MTNWVDWGLAVGAGVCAVLQLGSFRIGRHDHTPLLTGGRALLLAGWTIAAMRMGYLMGDVGDLPMPPLTQLWLALLETGTVLATLHWIVGDRTRA